MSAHLSAWSIITAHLAVLSDRESGEHATARLLKLYNPSLGHRVMAQRVPAGLQLLVAAASTVKPPPPSITCPWNPGRLFWRELSPISAQLIHMLIGLSPTGLCAIPNHSLYYAGQWISVIQVMLAVANWQEEPPTTAHHYNTGLQWGAASPHQAPPPVFLHLQGLWSDSLCLPGIKNIYVSY